MNRFKVKEMKVKEEPIEIKTSFEVKAEEEEEEKFSANKTSIQTVSIAFLNEETTQKKRIKSFNINKKLYLNNRKIKKL